MTDRTDDKREDDGKKRNGRLNLSHLTPEQIAKQMLETPPPKEKRKLGKKPEAVVSRDDRA